MDLKWFEKKINYKTRTVNVKWLFFSNTRIAHLLSALTWTVVHCWWCSECSRICWRRRWEVAPGRSASPSPVWRHSADQRRLVEERQLRSRLSSSPSSHSTTSLRMRQRLDVDYRKVFVLERVNGRICPWRVNAVATLFGRSVRILRSFKNRW